MPACGSLRRCRERPQQHRHPILPALAVANQDLVADKIDVLDPQMDPLHQAHTGTVGQAQHQPLDAAQMSEQCRNFLSRQNDRQKAAALGAHKRVEPRQLQFEHFAIHKQQGRKRLVLGGGAQFPIYGKVCEKSLDMRCAQVARVSLVVKQDIAFNPVDIRFLGANGIMLEAQALPHLVEQADRGGRSVRMLGYIGSHNIPVW